MRKEKATKGKRKEKERETGARVQEKETGTKETVGIKEAKATKVEVKDPRREDTRAKEKMRKSSQW